MLVLFPDYTEEGGLPSTKLAVYSNIQLKKCNCELYYQYTEFNYYWLVSLVLL